VGSLKMNTALEFSTRVVQEGDRRCKKSTLNDIVYLTPLRIPLMNQSIVHLHRLFDTEQWLEVTYNQEWVYRKENEDIGKEMGAKQARTRQRFKAKG
jgi:hypothetical protein